MGTEKGFSVQRATPPRHAAALIVDRHWRPLRRVWSGDTRPFMEPHFELFDHTADIGIRARAGTLAGLVRPAAEGLYAVIGGLATCGPPGEASWTLEADETSVLLRDYLAELLVLFEVQKRVAVEHAVDAFDEGRLVVRARTLAVDEERSDCEREVKAITYHALEIAEIEGGHEATIIVDI